MARPDCAVYRHVTRCVLSTRGPRRQGPGSSHPAGQGDLPPLPRARRMPQLRVGRARGLRNLGCDNAAGTPGHPVRPSVDGGVPTKELQLHSQHVLVINPAGVDVLMSASTATQLAARGPGCDAQGRPDRSHGHHHDRVRTGSVGQEHPRVDLLAAAGRYPNIRPSAEFGGHALTPFCVTISPPACLARSAPNNAPGVNAPGSVDPFATCPAANAATLAMNA